MFLKIVNFELKFLDFIGKLFRPEFACTNVTQRNGRPPFLSHREN